MAANKPPSLASPSCSGSNIRPGSSQGKLNMQRELQNSQPMRPAGLQNKATQPGESNCIPSMRSQSNLNLEVQPRRPVSVNTLRPSSTAHTRSSRPGSVLAQNVRSESHLPNPRLAKLLDRGWKSAQILPSYPNAGPIYQIPRNCKESVSLPTGSDSRIAVSTPRLRLDLVEPMAERLDASTKDQPLAISPDWEPELQLSDRSNLDTDRILHLPETLSCRSAPSRIPVRQVDIGYPSVSRSARALNDVERISRQSNAGIYRKPSCIPIPLFNTQSKEMLTWRSEAQSSGDGDTGASSVESSARALSVIGDNASRIPVLTSRSEKDLIARTELCMMPTSSVDKVQNHRSHELCAVTTTEVPSLSLLAQTTLALHNLKTSPAPKMHNVLSLKELAQASVAKLDLNLNNVVGQVNKVPTLKELAQASAANLDLKADNAVQNLKDLAKATVDKFNLKPNDDIQEKQNVHSLKQLAHASIAKFNLKDANVVPNLKELAKATVDKFNIKPKDVIQEKQNVQSLKLLAQESATKLNLKAYNIVPNLKALAQATVDQFNLKPTIALQEKQSVPSLKVLAQNAVDQLQVKPSNAVQVVPSLKELAKYVIVPRLTELPRSRPPTKMTPTGAEECNTSQKKGLEKRGQDNMDQESGWHYYSTQRATKGDNEATITEGKGKKPPTTDTSKANLQAPDTWEHASEETNGYGNGPVDLALYFKSFPAKAKVPTLKELAEAAIRKNSWIERCAQEFAKPKLSSMMFMSSDTEAKPTEEKGTESKVPVPEAGTESKVPLPEAESKCTHRLLKESDRMLKSAEGNRKRSRPPSRVSGNRRVLKSATHRVESETREAIKRPFSAPVVDKNEMNSAKLRAENLNRKVAIDEKIETIAASKDKKTESVAKKIDPEKILSMKYGFEDVSNSDVFKMVGAIRKDDNDAAKLFKELKLLDELEKERKIKETKLLQAETKTEAEINDFRYKLAATQEKKNKMDEKLLEMCSEKLLPETEFEVIENYLYAENLAKTYHEKINLEESCIAYLENELSGNDELRKRINPKCKASIRQNGGLQNKKGPLVKRGTRTDIKGKNFARQKDKIKRGPHYFREPDNNGYKPLSIKREEALRSDHSELRKKTNTGVARAINNRQKQQSRVDDKKHMSQTSTKGRRVHGKQLHPLRNESRDIKPRDTKSKPVEDLRQSVKQSHGAADINKRRPVKLAESANKSITRAQDVGKKTVSGQSKRVDTGVINKQEKRIPVNNKVQKVQNTQVKSNEASKLKQSVNKVKGRPQLGNTSMDLQRPNIENKRTYSSIRAKLDTEKNNANKKVDEKIWRSKLQPNVLRRENVAPKANSDVNNVLRRENVAPKANSVVNNVLRRENVAPKANSAVNNVLRRENVLPKANSAVNNNKRSSVSGIQSTGTKQSQALNKSGSKQRTVLPKLPQQKPELKKPAHRKQLVSDSKSDFVF